MTRLILWIIFQIGYVIWSRPVADLLEDLVKMPEICSVQIVGVWSC